MAPLSRNPYHGLHRKVVIAFDVGTTYSGVSYSILDPGEVPKIYGVNRFPAQQTVGGDSKIPTILYYNEEGFVEAIGAEAEQESIIERAEDEDWIKVEWFKLHLRPKNLSVTQINDNDLPPLPKNKTALDVLADFMRYLYQCTRTYIQDTHANGSELLESVDGCIDFILSHPNGWEGVQQSQMRHAAVLAGLVPDTQSGHARVQFVTEGEASLHFCIGSGLATDVLKVGNGLIIVDAGGGTVDMSAYAMVEKDSAFEEIAAAQCRLQGSVFVTRRARAFLADRLNGSKYGGYEDIRNITECFDKTTKLRFRNSEDTAYIRFGTARDKDIKYDIRSGQLKLPGSDIAELFEPSIDAIIEAIEEQRRTAHQPVAAVFLVGGFAASDWLFARLQEYLEPQELSFCRPDSHMSKAVADGAVSFYLDHFVSMRVARMTYGSICYASFDDLNPEHKRRSHKATRNNSGQLRLPNYFSVILAKGTRVSEDKEFRRNFFLEYYSAQNALSLRSEIAVYRGNFPDPQWTDAEPGMFSSLCSVEAEVSLKAKNLKTLFSSQNKPYYRQEFSIVLLFGLTELKAQICWMEDGEEKRGPASVVYDDMILTSSDP